MRANRWLYLLPLVLVGTPTFAQKSPDRKLVIAAAESEVKAPDQQTEKSKRNAQEALDAWMRSLRNRNVSQAYYSFTSKEFRSLTDLTAFKTFLQTYPSLSRNVSFKIQSVAYHDNMVQIVTLASSLTKEDNKVDIQLIFEDGAWKIRGIQVYPPSAALKIKE